MYEEERESAQAQAHAATHKTVSNWIYLEWKVVEMARLGMVIVGLPQHGAPAPTACCKRSLEGAPVNHLALREG